MNIDIKFAVHRIFSKRSAKQPLQINFVRPSDMTGHFKILSSELSSVNAYSAYYVKCNKGNLKWKLINKPPYL